MHNKNNVKDSNIINVKMKSLSLPNILQPIGMIPLKPNCNDSPVENDWVLIPKENEDTNENENISDVSSEDDYEYLKLNGTKYYMNKLLHKSMVSKVYLAHTVKTQEHKVKKQDVNEDNKEYFAIKIYLNDFKNQAENEHKLIELLHTLSIPNVIQLIDKKDGLLVMPYHERDLFDIIVRSQTTNRRFSGKSIKRYFTEVINTLYKMHSNNIVHLDIKPENIMITNDHHIQFIDFGFAKHIKNKKLLYCSKGTPFYAAPEIDDYESGYDPYKADVWSLGTTLYLMIELRRPFHMDKVTDNSSSAVWKTIENETLTFSKQFGKEYHLMISNMLKKDPNERWSMSEVKTENDRINDLIKVKI